MKAQGDVARALAEKRGWDYVELSNNLDPAIAHQERRHLHPGRRRRRHPVQRPALGRTRRSPQSSRPPASRSSPTTSPSRAFYFVGIDNLAAGIAGGEALGQIVKEKWNCEPDLVISSEGAGAGIVNEWRTGGMRTGLKNVCPDIPEEKYVSFEGSGQASVAAAGSPRPARRASGRQEDRSSSASMTAACSALIQAAEQLGRADEMIAWGQDGAFITGDNVNPHLAGSVFYFLEGYAVYAIRDVIDPIAAGNPPPVKDDAGDPASRVEPCPVSAAEAGQAVPDMPRARGSAPRGARRAPPPTSSSARRSRPKRLPMTDVATATPAAAIRRREAVPCEPSRRLGQRAVTVLGAWVAADRRDRRSTAPTSSRTRRCSRSPSPCRSSASSRSAQALVGISGGFSISASRQR